MSYEKQTWTTGETITAAKLNHMEEGIEDAGGSGGVLVVHETVTGTVHTLDKTWAEILAAAQTGGAFVVLNYDEANLSSFPVIYVYIDNGTYIVTTLAQNQLGMQPYNALSQDGYPSYSDSSPIG